MAHVIVGKGSGIALSPLVAHPYTGERSAFIIFGEKDYEKNKWVISRVEQYSNTKLYPSYLCIVSAKDELEAFQTFQEFTNE